MGRTKRKIDVIGRDLSDREIIRGYVENPERVQFTAQMVANTTLVSLDMVQHELKRLERMGVVTSRVKVGKVKVWQKAEENRTKPAKQAHNGREEKGTSETHVPTDIKSGDSRLRGNDGGSMEELILGAMEAGTMYRRAELSRHVGKTVQVSHIRHLLSRGLIEGVKYKSETRYVRKT